jgi:hypothetical protein
MYRVFVHHSKTVTVIFLKGLKNIIRLSMRTTKKEELRALDMTTYQENIAFQSLI